MAHGEPAAGYYDAWADTRHTWVYDRLALSPAPILKKHFESSNDVRLLRSESPSIRGARFFEIGCATGEFHRYLRRYLSRFDYRGFDISAPAIERATAKFGSDRFARVASIRVTKEEFGTASVVFCRDVVLHQERPFEFMEELLDIADECLVMRLRTRDVGATVFDPDLSCQRNYDKHWVPYIVLNTAEMVAKLAAHSRVQSITISRHYEVLGGYSGRYLPKDLYEKATGGAITAVLVRTGAGREEGSEAVLRYDDHPDGPAFSLWERAVDRLARMVWSRHVQ